MGEARGATGDGMSTEEEEREFVRTLIVLQPQIVQTLDKLQETLEWMELDKCLLQYIDKLPKSMLIALKLLLLSHPYLLLQ